MELTQMTRTRNRRARKSGPVALAIVAALVTMFTTLAPLPAPAAATLPPQPPDLEIEQDERMIEVVWHNMRAQGATKFGFKIKGFERKFRIKGTTKQPQIKLVTNGGERYKLWVRAYYPGYGWSAWSSRTVLNSPDIVAHPWSAQVSAGNRRIDMSWANVEADYYRWEVWNGSNLVKSGTVEGTQASATYLTNGTTYDVTVQAVYGATVTPRTPRLPATPNSGNAVQVALRDYEIEDPTSAIPVEVPTAVTGATGRVSSMSVELRTTDNARNTVEASYDHYAQATSGITGAWVTPTITVGPLDYEVVASASDSSGAVLASSLQTWLLGRVNAFTPQASQITRIGTYR